MMSSQERWTAGGIVGVVGGVLAIFGACFAWDAGVFSCGPKPVLCYTGYATSCLAGCTLVIGLALWFVASAPR